MVDSIRTDRAETKMEDRIVKQAAPATILASDIGSIQGDEGSDVPRALMRAVCFELENGHIVR